MLVAQWFCLRSQSMVFRDGEMCCCCCSGKWSSVGEEGWSEAAAAAISNGNTHISGQRLWWRGWWWHWTVRWRAECCCCVVGDWISDYCPTVYRAHHHCLHPPLQTRFGFSSCGFHSPTSSAFSLLSLIIMQTAVATFRAIMVKLC